MRPPTCTIDASCLIALDHLDLLPQLSLLYSRVLVPKAVRIELFRRRQTKDRLRAVFKWYAFVERCDDYDKASVDILLIERRRRRVKDRGEVEAVIQGAAAGAVVIVDDPWGRDLAERLGCSFHGTFWVLRRFFELGLSPSSVTRNHFVQLRRRGTFLPWDAVKEFLVSIGESPLPRMDGG